MALAVALVGDGGGHNWDLELEECRIDERADVTLASRGSSLCAEGRTIRVRTAKTARDRVAQDRRGTSKRIPKDLMVDRDVGPRAHREASVAALSSPVPIRALVPGDRDHGC